MSGACHVILRKTLATVIFLKLLSSGVSSFEQAGPSFIKQSRRASMHTGTPLSGEEFELMNTALPFASSGFTTVSRDSPCAVRS